MEQDYNETLNSFNIRFVKTNPETKNKFIDIHVLWSALMHEELMRHYKDEDFCKYMKDFFSKSEAIWNGICAYMKMVCSNDIHAYSEKELIRGLLSLDTTKEKLIKNIMDFANKEED